MEGKHLDTKRKKGEKELKIHNGQAEVVKRLFSLNNYIRNGRCLGWQKR